MKVLVTGMAGFIGMHAALRLLDVPATFADITRAAQAVGFAPRTPLAEGIERFVAWYRDYHAAAPGAPR